MTEPLGLIAGLGDLPVAIASNAVASGQGVYVLRLKGFEEPALAVVCVGDLDSLLSVRERGHGDDGVLQALVGGLEGDLVDGPVGEPIDEERPDLVS